MEQYGFTEEQEMMRGVARRIAKEKVAPRAEEVDAQAEYPQDLCAERMVYCRFLSPRNMAERGEMSLRFVW